MEPKILGANIRKYRKQIGITQEQLAEKIGKSVNYIGMIERGEKVPSFPKNSEEICVCSASMVTNAIAAKHRSSTSAA